MTTEINDKEVLLQIWDFGGEEQFRFLLPAYSHGSACGIFMFDLSRYSTIKDIEETGKEAYQIKIKTQIS